MLRTQIYLPKDLREKIDKERVSSGETMAEYIRKAAQERIEREENHQQDLKKLSDLVGSLKGTRTKEEIKKWEEEIKLDREEEDRHFLDRLDE